MITELYISWRYLFSCRREKFISLISLISVFGVAIGVMALIVVIAVMTGFDRDLREKIVGNYSHITLTASSPISNAEYDQILRKVGPNPHVRGISPFVQGQVLIREADRMFAVGIRGVNPFTESAISRTRDYITEGSLDELSAGEVIIGKELALFLGLGVGSQLRLYSPLGKEYTLTCVGIFASGMYEYDMNLVFTHLSTAQEIFGMPQQVNTVGIKLDDLDRAAQVRAELAGILGYRYILRTWMEVNKNFFAALELEKLTMFIILTLIILVASFNIISTLIVMVVDKTKDIGILKALGMSAVRIRRIFIFSGVLIGSVGILLGTAGGIGLCALLEKYRFIHLPQDIYYIDSLPVALEFFPDVALIVGAAMAIVLVATVYPARRASHLKPVDALRYE